jgi:hypothetical protein
MADVLDQSSPPISWNGLTGSLVPKAAQLAVASKIAGSPQRPLLNSGSVTLDDLIGAIRSAMSQPAAAARGFAAGASEGALDLLSPSNLASLAAGPAVRAGRAALGIAPTALSNLLTSPGARIGADVADAAAGKALQLLADRFLPDKVRRQLPWSSAYGTSPAEPSPQLKSNR